MDSRVAAGSAVCTCRILLSPYQVLHPVLPGGGGRQAEDMAACRESSNVKEQAYCNLLEC